MEGYNSICHVVDHWGQSESQQMFAFSDQGKEEKKLNDWLES